MSPRSGAPVTERHPERRRLLRPEPDLPRAARDTANAAISFVDDVVARYNTHEAEEFLRELHEQVVALWEEFEAHRRLREEPEIAVDDDRLAEIVSPRLTPEERASLVQRALTRRFERRRELRSESLTAPQVAKALQLSRQAPHDRRKAGRLLAVPFGGVWLFPAWQFDANSPDGVLPGLPLVLEALHHLSPLGQYAWLRTPKRAFDGNAPIDLMRVGEVEPVAKLAQGAGVA